MISKNVVLGLLLLPLSFIYLFGLMVNKFIYNVGIKKRKKLPGKTISIGNIVVGGTGKSPVVIALANYLAAKGQRPAILTRGYKSGLKKNESLLLVNGERKNSLTNLSDDIRPDEAIMQSIELKNIPVIVASNRYEAAQWYLKDNKEPTHWILDDGFQHWRLDRDLDFVLLDSKNPFSGGFLLPAGLLREPIQSLLRASCLIFTRSEKGYPTQKVKDYTEEVSKKKTFEVKFTNEWPVDLCENTPLTKEFKGKVFVAAALANSIRFKDEIEKMGFEIEAFLFKSDHENFFSDEILKKIGNSEIVITTAKDYWRDPSVFNELPIPCYVSSIKVAGLDNCFSEFLEDF